MKTSVKFKSEELLRKALSNIPGGVVGTTIRDYYGNETVVEMSVKTDKFERGIGFDKTEDEYQPQMDKYGHESACDGLMNQIQTQYRTAAVKVYYESKGYTVDVEETSPVEVQVCIRGY
jgi:Protein of unknown function (DUF1257).